MHQLPFDARGREGQYVHGCQTSMFAIHVETECRMHCTVGFPGFSLYVLVDKHSTTRTLGCC